ncbi:MAG: hypothetical protein E6J69_10855 [Deltaproteobacteria bacterium]|nr:MAG: hypothetical protein E6J69_10855 [Deltaproteobacteria bacterium]
MTSRARVLRITSGSLVLAFLMLTAGPHPVARAQHGAQIEKSCVNAARRACLQGTTAGCPGVNAGATCQTAADCQLPGGGVQAVCIGGPKAGVACASDRDCDNPAGVPNGICTATICVGGPNGGLRCTSADQCPGGSCTPCVPIPIASVGDPIACTITVTSVDPVDRIRLNTITDEISSRSPIVPTANLLPGFGFCRFSPTPGITGRMCIMNEDCTGSSCSTGSTCMGGIQAGLPCPTRADCPNGSCFDCLGGGVCQVSPHCDLAPNQLCMSQDDCAPASGPCVVVLGQAGDPVNVPFHPHCSATASVFCMTNTDCRPPVCTTCSPTETCVTADLTVLATDTNPLTDLARTSGIDEGTLQPVTLTFPGNVCIPPVTCQQTFPTCNGPCPSGQTCVVVGGTCVCQTPCENSAPTCNGTCPTGQTCASTPTGCVCQTPCANSAPTCDGTCPIGQVCASTPTGCVCQTPCENSAPACNGTCPPGVICSPSDGGCVCETPCANSAPMCNGICPTGQVCASTPTGCVCQTPCASSAPACNGTCPPGQVCSPTDGGCVCETPCENSSPTCNGTCPTGQVCASTPTGCVCQTPCENSAPACNGTCPPGQVCSPTDGGCLCQTPCETSSAPTCNGACPDNQVCAPTGDGSSCACQAGCRITGGGAIPGGGVDPTVMAETSVLTEFAGQVGAPCGCFGCFDNFDPKRASVQGEWKYKLKKHGGSLHASIFNSLVCSCLGGSVGSLCPSAEHPRTPADHICVTGIADLSPDTGNGNKASTPVAFRFEATDNGEPGTSDVYEIHILAPAAGQSTSDVAKAICCTRPFVQPAGTTALANDLGTILRGNIQIHPALAKSTDGTCPPPSGMCVPIP